MPYPPTTPSDHPPETAVRGRRLFVHAEADAGGRLSRATSTRILLLFGPAAFVLVVLRLLQYSLINTTGKFPIGSLLLGPALPPFFLVLLLLASGLLVRSTWPRLRTGWLLAGILLPGAGIMTAAAAVIPTWMTGWMSLQAFEVIRWDLLVLLVLALFAALLLESLRGLARRLFLVTLHALLPVLLMLPVAELGSILSLGAAPDWSMLAYAFRHLGELAPVLSSEIGPAQAVLLLLPVALSLLPPWIERLSAAPLPQGPRPGTRPAQAARHLGATALPLLMVLTLPPSTPLPPTHRTISYAGMVRSMLEDVAAEPAYRSETAGAVTAPFDARALRLAATDSTRRMNVVVILLESFRSRSVTPYHPALDTTPFLDSLARHSLLVEQMYAVVSYTNKSLAPVLAGIYPELSLNVVEARPEGLPGVGLPTLLKPFGYRSAFFTPARLDFERKDRILEHLGFETKRGDGSFPTDGFHVTNYFGYEDRIVLEPSMQWVDEATATGQPFFLTYLTLTAHHDYRTPPTFPHRRYVEHDEKLNDYLNALRYTDDFLRDLFRAFERRNLTASTLFILLGDHGEAFGEHGLKMHGDVLWDEALQVPALLYSPGLFPEGGRVEGLRQHIDVMPTVADALGYRIEGGTYPGASLLRPVPEDRTLYHNARNGSQALALRQDSLKFFYYYRRRPMEVYDLHRDPLERHDLAARMPPERLKAVELRLLLWRRNVQQLYGERAGSSDVYAAR